MPEMEFSMWYEWDHRHSYTHRCRPGVYLIAITNRKNLAGTQTKWKDVVYIGMTNSVNGLAGRWYQLDRTIKGGHGHSGGKSMRKALGDYGTWDKKVYVAALPVDCDVATGTPEDYIKMGWVAFYEYEAFSEYAKAVGGHPKYNKR